MVNDKFIGLGGFLWFSGVVEDRNDPNKVGRVRVRALGISGLGHSATGLVEGSWVLGYFRDGNERQEMIIMGTLPGVPAELSQSSGFYDPNGIYPKYKDEPDTNRLAVNNIDKPHLANTLRTATRITGIATADFNAFPNADGSSVIASDGDTFDQPAIPYNAVYPYNNVFESESGHLMEYDDTLSNERIHQRHRTGTSYEIDSQGNKVEIIKGESYRLLSNKEQVQITGNSDITIDGRHKLYINKSNTLNNHYDIQIGAGASINIQVDSGDVNIHTIQGRINMNAGGDYNLKVGGNYTVEVAGNTLETIEGTKTSNTTGAVTHRGSTIDLNP